MGLAGAVLVAAAPVRPVQPVGPVSPGRRDDDVAQEPQQLRESTRPPVPAGPPAARTGPHRLPWQQRLPRLGRVSQTHHDRGSRTSTRSPWPAPKTSRSRTTAAVVEERYQRCRYHREQAGGHRGVSV